MSLCSSIGGEEGVSASSGAGAEKAQGGYGSENAGTTVDLRSRTGSNKCVHPLQASMLVKSFPLFLCFMRSKHMSVSLITAALSWPKDTWAMLCKLSGKGQEACRLFYEHINWCQRHIGNILGDLPEARALRGGSASSLTIGVQDVMWLIWLH